MRFSENRSPDLARSYCARNFGRATAHLVGGMTQDASLREAAFLSARRDGMAALAIFEERQMPAEANAVRQLLQSEMLAPLGGGTASDLAAADPAS